MNLKDKITELWALKEAENKLVNELKTHINEYAETNRKLQPGDIVEVYSDEHEYLGDGVIGDVRSCLFLDPLDVKDYVNGSANADENLKVLRYEVYAKTKDNKASKKHLFSAPHFIMHEIDFNIKRRGFEYVKLKANETKPL